ncbi:MAG: crossover junction endodeoxyribonuclease RuvC [Hydrogenovibrio crunogenus]|uniref:Crossover junction endodeoxyribonuclease RuvC n=1 Tax=Hydrogenovibrio crunogenus (strain DSM 25203 / XCL-2) TaxID=317025 RepID=RUVC_HYDCU|nr:RecName: Full=Crossover junction endodeoxyribonuclease RuvC; AltName: Full=Holliday junction nuclease RuvC; AltName: Full=Holliday junction resolvase RuvC [Hydrogenovibrio crunogenus XCL-2]MBD3610925.1 crossover junction endodeoxyribonuclease RuvC [Hydrogenovibrio crunogenus]
MAQLKRILGIDPGSRKTGFGIIESGRFHPNYVSSGVIRVEKLTGAQRLKTIFESVCQIIDQYQPHVMAIEKVFVYKNPSSAIKLGQARGVILCAAAIKEIPIMEYTPTQIKSTIVGQGHATKDQVQFMVQNLLKLTESPQEDAADALAGALCHDRYLTLGIDPEKISKGTKF